MPVLFGWLTVQGCTPSAQELTKESGASPPDKLSSAPRVGRPAPDFILKDLDGTQFRLSDLRGKVVFINFWASWCPPCRAEMPEIEAVYQKYKDKGVVVVGIDIQEQKDVVRQFVGQGGYSWTFVLDSTGEVARDYQIVAIPTSFFLDKEGVIQAAKVGAMTKREIEFQLVKTMK